MRLRISENWYAVIEILGDKGEVVVTIPFGFIEADSEYEFDGIVFTEEAAA